MNKVFLLLGSNMGKRRDIIRDAIEKIADACGDIILRSSLYETAAWGKEDQPEFLNMALCIKTECPPLELLSQLHNIENAAGRIREMKWGQRTLDIDILFYNDEITDLPELKIPHPYIQDRRFTLAPLAEIAPDFLHPRLKKTLRQLLAECPDKLEVKKYATLS